MPTYDVRCEHCGHIFEETLKQKEDVGLCPLCCSAFTRKIWLQFPSIDKAKDPYEYINKAPTRPVSVSVPKEIKKND